MVAITATGQSAAVKKYDILTALSTWALDRDKHCQRLALRLTALITARYNWRSGEVSIGQAEIARLWSVDVRTVKREMSRLKDMGWIEVLRPGARGRVGTYRIHLDRILLDTRPVWHKAGADFEARVGTMVTNGAEAPAKVVHVQFGAAETDKAGEGPLPWSGLQALLRERHPDLYRNWFKHLRFVGFEGQRLHLRAQSPFMARYIAGHLAGILIVEAAAVFPGIRDVSIV